MSERTASHWAAEFIGAPYKRGATGPDAYDCWGLVRAALRLRGGADLPAFDSAAGRPAGILAAARAAGWRCVEGPAADGDVLRMRHVRSGWAHVGLAIAPRRQVMLLHASEADGRVCCALIDDLPALGFTDFRLWRLL